MAPSVFPGICSICGEALAGSDGCLTCLLRAGLAQPGEERSCLPDSLGFGDFEIALREDGSLWELGRGAMGVTYRARDKVLHRDVALKVIALPSDAEVASAARERFLREARAAAALRHPNVASVFQFGAHTEAERCYYAMELVEGETLKAFVQREGPLPPLAALEIAVQLARALIAAAAHGLIHRDLKPANIMLSPNDSETMAKVIDFGLAKAPAEAGQETDLTQGAFVGTPTYASPEQLAGQPSDARSDIYSLGATLWYALTAEVPYPGRTTEEIRVAQMELPLPVEQLRMRKVPATLIKLLRHSLALKQAERPASARALLNDLEECRAGLLAAPRRRRAAAMAFGICAIAALGLMTALLLRREAADLKAEKSIAVLPFENRGADQTSVYFTEGVQDEILTRLTRITDLKVIAPTSTKKYRARPQNLKTVAADLGVRDVLEGSVQRAGRKMRVGVQLIDARSARQLWAETYDRSLTDVFAVQSEIAGEVAHALHARITAQESVALQSVPTFNQQAYDLFLQGEHFLRTGRANFRTSDVLEAVEFYRQAVAADPQFALAYARVSLAESFLHWSGSDIKGASAAELAHSDAEKAAALQPDLMEAHLALGYYDFWGRLDYPSALEHLTRARALSPRSAEVLSALGLVYARQLRFDESLAVYQRAMQDDPGNSKLIDELATVYWWAGRFEMVPPTCQRALAVDPDNQGTVRRLARWHVMRYGDVEAARRILQGSEPRVQALLAWTYSLTRDYEKAAHLIEELPADSPAFAPSHESKDELLGLYLHRAGDESHARPMLERARNQCIALLNEPTHSSRRVAFHAIRLARLEATLGNFDAAIQVAERGAQSQAVTRDPMEGAAYDSDLAEIYARAGRKSAAIALLSRQLKGPPVSIDITPVMLRLDPRWDPLRNEPEFQALLEQYPAKLRVR